MSDLWLFIMGNSASFILSFPFDRGFIHLILTYRLNRSNYRKRAKGQNFLDWLLYRRYRDVIPKGWIIHYCLTPIFYILTVISTVILFLLGVDSSYFRIPLCIFYGRLLLTNGYVWISWYDGKANTLDPGKTITRTGRNRNKK